MGELRRTKAAAIAAVLFTSLLASPPGAADVIQDEVMANVIQPCHVMSVERNRVEGVDDEVLLEVLEITQAAQTAKVVEQTRKVVQGKSKSERMALYALFRQACIGALRPQQ